MKKNYIKPLSKVLEINGSTDILKPTDIIAGSKGTGTNVMGAKERGNFNEVQDNDFWSTDHGF